MLLALPTVLFPSYNSNTLEYSDRVCVPRLKKKKSPYDHEKLANIFSFLFRIYVKPQIVGAEE
jgi:hypothetical protein